MPKPEAIEAGWNRTPIQAEESLDTAWQLDAAGVVSDCEDCNEQTVSGVIFHGPLDSLAEIPDALLADTSVIEGRVEPID